MFEYWKTWQQKLPQYCPQLVDQKWRLQPLVGCKRDLCLKVELLGKESLVPTDWMSQLFKCFSIQFQWCSRIISVHCSIWIIGPPTKMTRLHWLCGANENLNLWTWVSRLRIWIGWVSNLAKCKRHAAGLNTLPLCRVFCYRWYYCCCYSHCWCYLFLIVQKAFGRSELLTFYTMLVFSCPQTAQ